jgi:UDP-N-acetylglucosamine pyrophosphorylase
MAGGQGTRLGSSLPKGCYTLTVPGHGQVSLFQLQARRLLALGAAVNWLILTSPQTDKETRKFFADNDYFGYPKEQVTFFLQSNLPAMTETGEIIVDGEGRPVLAPNGNGGIFQALQDNQIFETVLRTVDYFHVFSVDNVLIKPCDPVFVGFAASNQADVASKSVLKRSPSEKAGVFALNTNKVIVAEYSELKGFSADDVNIANHIFSVPFAKKCAQAEFPLHLARKAIKTGPDSSIQGFKLEYFIFDAFPLADKNVVLRVDRESEFAPLKNANGEDSPVECVKALERLLKKNGRIY